jgi:hypothetical protein
MYTKKFNNRFKVVVELGIKSNRVSCFYSLSLIFVLNLISLPTNAQCAMCRAALTSNENSTQAAAVNDELFIW